MVPLEFYERAVQLLPDRGVAAVCPETHEFRAVNDAYAKILETTPSSLIGTTWISHTVEEDVGYDLTLVQEVVDGKREHYILTKRYRSRTGRIVPVTLLVGRFPPAGHGPLELLVAIVTDETDSPVSPHVVQELQVSMKKMTERLTALETGEVQQAAKEVQDFKRASKILIVGLPALGVVGGFIMWILQMVFG